MFFFFDHHLLGLRIRALQHELKAAKQTASGRGELARLQQDVSDLEEQAQSKEAEVGPALMTAAHRVLFYSFSCFLCFAFQLLNLATVCTEETTNLELKLMEAEAGLGSRHSTPQTTSRVKRATSKKRKRKKRKKEKPRRKKERKKRK